MEMLKMDYLSPPFQTCRSCALGLANDSNHDASKTRRGEAALHVPMASTRQILGMLIANTVQSIQTPQPEVPLQLPVGVT